MALVRAIAVLVVGLVLLAGPASAGAAVSSSFDDSVGDTPEFAPDLGATTVTVGDDDVLTVNTRIVPRPPAFWGGCAYYVAGICMPANMNVTWYFDYAPSAGSVADDGADAKVVAVPSRGQTVWEGSRWDTANGRFRAGAQPAATEDPGGVVWTLRLADLGIPKPATLRVWAVSLYHSYNGLGVLFDYSDRAGPSTISIPAPPSAGGGSGDSDPVCRQAVADANRLQRRLRKAKRAVARGGGRKARLRLARLQKSRNNALKGMRSNCTAPVDPVGPPPATPPPGCQLVTKPVLQQEGAGIYAPWVIKPEVVVECSK